MKPLVSIIVTIHNGESFVREALESVMNQDYENIEIIAVDDSSVDSTPDIVNEYPEVKFLRHQVGRESKTRNLGLSVAQGAFVGFLDHDDLFLPTKISAQVKYLQKHSSAQICVPLCEGFMTRGEKPNWVRWGALSTHKDLSPSAWLVRRELFQKIGKFNEALGSGCDFEWIKRVRDCGCEVGTINTVLWKKRIHRKNTSAFSDKARAKTYYHELLTSLRRPHIQVD